MAAARGSSVMIPIAGAGQLGLVNGALLGYGTEASTDWQRGRIRLWLDVTPNPDVELTVRGVSRVEADRASPAGLSQSAVFGVAGQAVVLVDVPLSAPVGTWPLIARRWTYQWNGSDWIEQQLPTSQGPVYEGSLQVLDRTGPMTPFEASIAGWVDVSLYIPDFIPLPRLYFQVSTSVPAGATHLVLTYPAARVAIRGVVAEPIGDQWEWGKTALVGFSESAPGVLEIHCTAPEGTEDPAFSIVFELTHPWDPPASGGGPVSVSNFNFTTVQAWNVDGGVISGTVASKTIR